MEDREEYTLLSTPFQVEGHRSLWVIVIHRLFWTSYISYLIWCVYIQQVLLSSSWRLFLERTRFNVFTVITRSFPLQQSRSSIAQEEKL